MKANSARRVTPVRPTRGTATAVKLRGVEASRGIAAVLVVLRHATDLLAVPKYFGTWPLGGLFIFGNAGIDFFFVLSGFIIYHVHREDIGRPSRVPGYAWKRFVRIYPIYWIVFTGLGLILLYSPEKNPAVTSPANVFASVLLLPRVQWPVLGVAWTLRHEVMFYTLFCVLLLNRAAGRLVLVAWAVLIGWNIAIFWTTGSPFFHGLAGSIPFRIFNIEFFFGMGVALLLNRGTAWCPRLWLLLGVVIFFGNGLIESFGPHVPPEWPPRQLPYALGAAMAVYGLVGAERAGTLTVPGPLVTLGSASYSVYLTHLITIMVLEQALLRLRSHVPLPRDVTFLVIAAIAILGGVVFSRLVEQPLLRRLRRRPPRIAVAT